MIVDLSGPALLRATAMFGGFVVALFVASRLVPGRAYQGVPLRDGTRKTYRLNGLTLLLLTWVGLGAWMFLRKDPTLLAALHTHFFALLVVANVFAFALTLLLYVVGRNRPNAERRLLHGLFYGAELNPTWLGVDLKMFAYRPSLIGLNLLNLSFAAAQLKTYGAMTTRMWAFQAFTGIYVLNYFQFEYGMLHTWDVIAENFGWMLVWGDYVLVPFFYCIAGWGLLHNQDPISSPLLIALCVSYVVGFWLFRGANDQKHRYKTDPQARIWGRPPEVLGGKLLVSGFWGIGRHLNYTGEILVYLSWTLLAGTRAYVPWLLPLWLIGLLTHRAWRDDQRCREKYGPLWTEYCSRARFRMLPFVY